MQTFLTDKYIHDQAQDFRQTQNSFNISERVIESNDPSV